MCKHFFDISNDCVQEIDIHEKIFVSNHVQMLDALSTFKFLKSIKIKSDEITKCARSIDFFLMHAMENCPRFRFIETSHKLSVRFLNHVAQNSQNLYGLDLNFYRTDAPGILSPLKNGMKNLKHLGLYDLKRSNYEDQDLLSLVENCMDLNSIKKLFPSSKI